MEKKFEQSNTSCIRVVLFGPESTGKTTLAKAFAEKYDTQWVPEFMREFLQKKWDTKGEKCTIDDLIPIAEGQMRLENEKAITSNTFLFCDTNLLEIAVYSKYYFDGFCPTKIEEYAVKNKYDLYFLTDIDVPWIFDDLRDRPDNRQEMFRIFERELITNHLPYVVLSGSFEERLDQAEKALKRLKIAMNAK